MIYYRQNLFVMCQNCQYTRVLLIDIMDTKISNQQQHRLYAALLIIVIAYCYEYALRISPSIMPHQLMKYFSINAIQLGWLTSFFYWPYIIMQPFVGGLINKLRFRTCIAASIFLCSISCLFYPEWTSFSPALASRFLMGIGSSFSYIGAITLARNYLQERFFVLFDGCIVSLGMIFPFLLNVSAKKIILSHGWIILNDGFVIIGILISIISYITLPKATITNHDRPQCKQNPIWQYYYQLLCNKNILLIGFIGFLFYVSLSLFSGLWGPALVQHLYHLDPIKSLTVSNAVFLGWIIGSPLQNFWIKHLKFNYKKLYQINAMIGFLSLISLLYTNLPFYFIYISLFIFGLACSTQITCFAYSLKIIRNIPISCVIACMNTMMVSSAIIQPLGGYLMQLFNSNIPHHVLVYSDESYISLVILMLVAMASAIASSFFLD